MSNDDLKTAPRMLQSKDCYVCGIENPAGLKISFFYDGSSVSAEFTPGEEFCGFNGIVHGGIIYALADEAMMHLVWASGRRATSAEIKMRYHNYARTGVKLKLTAEFEEIKPRLITARCRISDNDERKIATASGKFLPFADGDEEIFKKRF